MGRIYTLPTIVIIGNDNWTVELVQKVGDDDAYCTIRDQTGHVVHEGKDHEATATRLAREIAKVRKLESELRDSRREVSSIDHMEIRP